MVSIFPIFLLELEIDCQDKFLKLNLQIGFFLSLIGIISKWGFLIWELIFIHCGLFALILVVFCVVSSFTTLRPNFSYGLLQGIYRDLG